MTIERFKQAMLHQLLPIHELMGMWLQQDLIGEPITIRHRPRVGQVVKIQLLPFRVVLSRVC